MSGNGVNEKLVAVHGQGAPLSVEYGGRAGIAVPIPAAQGYS